MQSSTNPAADTSAAPETPVAPAVDPITVAALAALAKQNYSDAYLIGYLGASLRWAAMNHPDDADLRREVAVYEAWRAHQAEQRATSTARRTATEAQVTR